MSSTTRPLSSRRSSIEANPEITAEEVHRIMLLYSEPWSNRDNLRLGRMIQSLLDRGVSQQELSRRTRSHLNQLERQASELRGTKAHRAGSAASTSPSGLKAMTPGTIHHFVSLLDLPSELQDAIKNRTLKFKAARALVDLIGDFDGHEPVSTERLIELSQPFMTRRVTTQHAEKYVAYAKRRPELTPDELIEACLNGPPPPLWDEDDYDAFSQPWSSAESSGPGAADFVGIEYGRRNRRRPSAYAPLAGPGELLERLRSERQTTTAIDTGDTAAAAKMRREASIPDSRHHDRKANRHSAPLRKFERPGTPPSLHSLTETDATPSATTASPRRSHLDSHTLPEPPTPALVKELAEKLFSTMSSLPVTGLGQSPDALLARVYLRKLQGLLDLELRTERNAG